MMDYKGCKCASCHKVLKEGDDIVICPECGARMEEPMTEDEEAELMELLFYTRS